MEADDRQCFNDRRGRGVSWREWNNDERRKKKERTKERKKEWRNRKEDQARSLDSGEENGKIRRDG